VVCASCFGNTIIMMIIMLPVEHHHASRVLISQLQISFSVASPCAEPALRFVCGGLLCMTVTPCLFCLATAVLYTQLPQADVRMHVEAQLLQRLLQLSLQPQHDEGAKALDLLLQLPAAVQLSTLQVLQLLLAILRAPRHTDADMQQDNNKQWLQKLCVLPAAAQLDEQAMVQVWQALISSQHSGIGPSLHSQDALLQHLLLLLPQMKQLQPRVLLQLLQLALARPRPISGSDSWRFCVQQLLGSTTAQQLQPAEAVRVVKLALHSGDISILEAICQQLQPLRLASTATVVALVQEAVDLGSWDALRVLRSSLPGAVQVMGAGLVEGLQELLDLEVQ
jgi:hypothetical protein